MSQAYKKQNIWNQLKSKTSNDLLKAIKKDGNWKFINSEGSRHIFINENNPPNKQVVSIHYHKTKKGGYGVGMLKDILETIGWTEDQMKALKLIKKK